MSLLLDTHVVIWAMNEPDRIPIRIRKIIEAAAGMVFVSHVSLWEIATKYPLGRRTAPPQSARQTAEDAVKAGFLLLPLQLDHILAFERIPLLDGDPADRLLVAQALTEGLSLVTHDDRLAAYVDTVIAW
jgi:PIN domain nuclease of toxin-antitoxin system